MMARLGSLNLPTTLRAWLWPGLTIFFALCVLLSLARLGGVGEHERKRAFDASQRFTINPATGDIAIAKKAAKPEVKPATTEPADKPADKPAEPKPEQPAGSTDPAKPAPADAAGSAPPTGAAPTTPPAVMPAAAPSAPAPAQEKPAPATSAPEPAKPSPVAVTPAQATPQAAPATETKASPQTKPEPSQPAAAVSSGSTPSLRTEPLSTILTAPTRTKDSLVAAPAPEASEKVDGLVLPKTPDNGVAPSKLYARPFHRTSDQVLLCFVVLDGGLDTQSIGLLLALPPEVTIAYSPYAKGDSYSEHLRAAGHEVWAMLPTMNEGYPADDPGPMGLVNRMPAEEILRRTHLVMAAVPGSVGLVLPADETITQFKDSLKPVVAEISKRGLFLMESNPTKPLDQISAEPDMKKLLTKANLVLDSEADEAQIRSKLSGLLDAVEENHEYVVVLSARPQTLQILNEWLHETALEKPIMLAPLSAVYQPVAAAEEVSSEPPKESKKKPKPAAPKKPKILPQDQYLKPAGEKKDGDKKDEKKDEKK